SQYVTIFHPTLAFREYSDKMASYLFGPTFFGLFLSDQFEDDPIYRLFRARAGAAHFDPPAKDPVARRRQFLASFFLRGARIPLRDAGVVRARPRLQPDEVSAEVDAAAPGGLSDAPPDGTALVSVRRGSELQPQRRARVRLRLRQVLPVGPRAPRIS